MRPAAAGVARAIATAGIVVALDQATKQIVVHSLALGESSNVFLGLDITNTRNTGVAFGALAGGGAIVTVVVAVALAALLAYFATHIGRRLVWLPTGMLLGGAVGNVIDRARQGAVTDFIQIPLGFPAFNVADTSITLGVLVLLYVIERDGAAGRS